MNASSVFRVRRVSEWLAPQDDSLSSGLGKDSTKAINQFGYDLPCIHAVSNTEMVCNIEMP